MRTPALLPQVFYECAWARIFCQIMASGVTGDPTDSLHLWGALCRGYRSMDTLHRDVVHTAVAPETHS